jgi:hypothetical protein
MTHADELGSDPDTISWTRVPLCMVSNTDSFVGLGRTQIQWILPKAMKVSHINVYTFMEKIRCKTKENSSIFSMYYDKMQENIANT